MSENIRQDTPVTIKVRKDIVVASIESDEFKELEYHLDNLFNELLEFCTTHQIPIFCNHSKSSIREGQIILQVYGHLENCKNKPVHKELIVEAISNFEEMIEIEGTTSDLIANGGAY